MATALTRGLDPPVPNPLLKVGSRFPNTSSRAIEFRGTSPPTLNSPPIISFPSDWVADAFIFRLLDVETDELKSGSRPTLDGAGGASGELNAVCTFKTAISGATPMSATAVNKSARRKLLGAWKNSIFLSPPDL